MDDDLFNPERVWSHFHTLLPEHYRKVIPGWDELPHDIRRTIVRTVSDLEFALKGEITMAKMTEEEMKRYYEKPLLEVHIPGDIEALEGEALLNEMEFRSRRALARCASVLDEFYPCFEKTIKIKLRDVKRRVPDQAVECEVIAYLADAEKRTASQELAKEANKSIERMHQNECDSPAGSDPLMVPPPSLQQTWHAMLSNRRRIIDQDKKRLEPLEAKVIEIEKRLKALEKE